MYLFPNVGRLIDSGEVIPAWGFLPQQEAVREGMWAKGKVTKGRRATEERQMGHQNQMFLLLKHMLEETLGARPYGFNWVSTWMTEEFLRVYRGRDQEIQALSQLTSDHGGVRWDWVCWGRLILSFRGASFSHPTVTKISSIKTNFWIPLEVGIQSNAVGTCFW